MLIHLRYTWWCIADNKYVSDLACSNKCQIFSILDQSSADITWRKEFHEHIVMSVTAGSEEGLLGKSSEEVGALPHEH